MVNVVLQAGADTSQKFAESDGVVTTDWTPLAFAMTKGADLVVALLDAKADVSQRFERPVRELWTPLGFAIDLQNAQLVPLCGFGCFFSDACVPKGEGVARPWR
jgi:hypothetical protein